MNLSELELPIYANFNEKVARNALKELEYILSRCGMIYEADKVSDMLENLRVLRLSIVKKYKSIISEEEEKDHVDEGFDPDGGDKDCEDDKGDEVTEFEGEYNGRAYNVKVAKVSASDNDLETALRSAKVPPELIEGILKTLRE